MANKNKYWGLLAVGALTAAAAGAVAACVLKKNGKKAEYFGNDFEDDFDDDFFEEEDTPTEEKDTTEAFAEWEAVSEPADTNTEKPEEAAPEAEETADKGDAPSDDTPEEA